MNQEQILDLLKQAAEEGVIEMECPECGDTITSEPDAEELYCGGCEKMMKNPLVTEGLI